MPSPFPGMNPYIERDTVFPDFHHHFASVAVELLVPQIRPRYFAKVEVDVYLHEASAEDRHLLGRPGIFIGDKVPQPATGNTTMTHAPAQALIPVPVDIIRLPHVEIFDKDHRDAVTIIELLSPTNKFRSEDRSTYISKRQHVFRTSTHFVEIDLLRGGPRLPMDDLPDCDYYALVSREEDRPHVGVWPIKLRDRLPAIPIPLRSPDPDAQLDLQTVLNRIYDAVGFADYIYDGNPNPPLHPEDAAWAKELLRLA